MTRYAVIGKPVSHSKSPLIHQQFARQTGEAVEYQAVEVEEGQLSDFISEFFDQGGGGLNITVPYKEKAFTLSSRLSERAQHARAVNTLWQSKEGELWGDNTDGIGLVRDIEENNNYRLQGKKLLLLGAGGAARGALPALINAGIDSITIANRTLERAQQLQTEFSGLMPISISSYEGLEGEFDVVINATSLSLAGKVPAVPESSLAKACCCYDMMYDDEPTAFLQWADQQGASLTLDGLGMLVEQAAESFAIWRGVRPPDTASVIALLRGH